ncbi:hypothetical protein MYX76_09235 [Desulfobacterota bacterium AH_259_B03_O07]|nr:hypothetical protein [Desulfobacterota bacterium AH_259_B03_O07]
MESVVAVIFLITSYLSGYVLTVRFLPTFSGLLRIASAYIIGILISVWLLFILSLIFSRFVEQPITVGFTVTTAVLLAFTIHQRVFFKAPPGLRPIHVFFFIIVFLFSWILFSSTFEYDEKLNEIKIGFLIWSDYGLHIPLIRSFSLGNNLSLECPLYAHEAIRYHFLFDFMIGALEKMGLPLDYALNIPGALSWTCLLILIYYFSKKLFFGSRYVGFVSATLFLFNSSLSWVEFLKKYHPNSFDSFIKSWWNLPGYVAFGPWDGNIISAFWTWNIYINQRNLSLGFAVVLLVLIYYIDAHINKKIKTTYGQKALLGLITGLLVLWHGMAFISLFGLIGLFFLLFPDRKKSLLAVLVALTIAIPQILFLNQSSPNVQSHFSFMPGYLVISHLIPVDYFSSHSLNHTVSWILSFFRYWFFNLGISLISIVISFFIIDIQRKKIFLMFLSIFVIGSLFRFSADMQNNHKFFCLWLILSNTFTAYLLYRIFLLGWIGKIVSIIILVCLTISGFIDIMPIKNDRIMTYADVQKQPLAKWVLENTDTADVFLTTHRIHNPIGYAGRKTMQGWPSFAWSWGYDIENRVRMAKEIYETNSKEELCKLLKENRIDFVQTEKTPEGESQFKINHEFFDYAFKPVFIDKKSSLKERVFATKDMCPQDE